VAEADVARDPIYKHKDYDIPSLAWGRFRAPRRWAPDHDHVRQAHHGFVDGYHIHLLAEAIAARIARTMT
jgi:chloramphenicol O-acetyltransferase